MVNLSPTFGAEITKTRPCVITSSNEIGILPLKIIVPITDYKTHYDGLPWMLELSPNGFNNLSKSSVVDLFQLRSVSNVRLIKNIVKVTEGEFQKNPLRGIY